MDIFEKCYAPSLATDLQEKGVRKRTVRGKGACVERDCDPGRHGAAGFSGVAGGHFCPDRIGIL